MKELNMMKYIYLLVVVVLLTNCTLTDNDQPIPAYLEITGVDISTTPSQGAPSHKITDVWAYADNQLLGVFEIPCKIPILINNETTDFLIFPGFRNNGDKSRSFTYNVMNQFRFTENIAPGDIIQKSLTFTYKEDVIFDFVEGFEGGSHIFTRELDDDLSTRIIQTTEDKKSGAQSGKITLTAENPFISVGNIFDFNRIDNAGLDSYFEMDYKNDIPFFVGVIYQQEGEEVINPLILLNPTDGEWNKIYIDYTSILSSPAIDNYSVYITTDLESLDLSSGTIYLDNLKFVHQ
jgi:hypothetical protein